MRLLYSTDVAGVERSLFRGDDGSAWLCVRLDRDDSGIWYPVDDVEAIAAEMREHLQMVTKLTKV